MTQLMQLPVVESVTCDGCGACCLHMGAPFFACFSVDGEEPSFGGDGEEPRGWEPAFLAMPEELRRDHMAYVDGLTGSDPLGQPCRWLDLETRKCRHYEYRPKVCREFEVGGEGCLEWRARNLV